MYVNSPGTGMTLGGEALNYFHGISQPTGRIVRFERRIVEMLSLYGKNGLRIPRIWDYLPMVARGLTLQLCIQAGIKLWPAEAGGLP